MLHGVTLLTIAGFSAAGCAQLCEDRPDPVRDEARGAYVLNEPGPLGYVTHARGYTPDRRPIAVIQPFSGVWTEENPFGFRKQFAAREDKNGDGVIDAQAWMLGEFEAAWEAGFRRFMISRPGGMLAENITGGINYVPQESFAHLEPWRQRVYTEAVAGWFAHKLAADPDAELGVFIGAMQNNTRNPCHTPTAGGGVFDCSGTDAGQTRCMNASDRRSAELTFVSTRVWIEAGFNAVWFDSAARPGRLENNMTAPDTILAMRDNPDYAGVKISGEAVPRRYVRDAADEPLMEYVQGAAWIATHQFLESSRMGSLTFDPATTEVVAAFLKPEGTPKPHPNPGYRIGDMAGYRDRGFVLAAWDDFAHPFIQRLDDAMDDTLGPIGVLDFDADGHLTCADWDLMHENWARNHGRAFEAPAVWDGDIDDDGDVDDDDRTIFEERWGLANGPRCRD